MTEIHTEQSTERLIVELRPDEHDEQMWTLLAHMAEYLWTNFSVAFDCDYVEVHLVYGADAGRVSDRREAPES